MTLSLSSPVTETENEKQHSILGGRADTRTTLKDPQDTGMVPTVSPSNSPYSLCRNQWVLGDDTEPRETQAAAPTVASKLLASFDGAD